MRRSSIQAAILAGLSLSLGVFATGCGGTDDDAPGATHIEIKGTWGNSIFMETDVIDDDTWSAAVGDADPTVSEVVEFSNGERYAVLSGPDLTDPDKTVYSRNYWTKPENDAFYFCTATFGCETAELTATGDDDPDNKVCDAPTPDANDYGTGCNHFSWTQLAKK